MHEQGDDEATRRQGADAAGSDPTSARGSASQEPGDNALPPGTRLAEFEIQGVIGEGGFSIVYRAWDHSLHRTVALKEYVPVQLALRNSALRVTARSQRHRETFDAGLRSFVNEARLLASFDHPSLVKVYRFWEDHGTAYMAMPWYRGPTLKAALAARGQPPGEDWLKRLAGSITEALAVIHEQQCYHRDIAPDNIILLGPTETPLLLDFGAARRIVGSMTHDLTAILKKGYAPVEQYGEIPGMQQGPWTDVYALAAVLHYALTGDTVPEAVGRLANDTFVPLSRLLRDRYSAGFLGAIDRALAVRPEHRTQTVSALREQLGLDRPQALHPATAPPPSRPPERKRRRPLLTWVLGGIGVSAAAAALLLFIGGIPPRSGERSGAGATTPSDAPAEAARAPGNGPATSTQGPQASASQVELQAAMTPTIARQEQAARARENSEADARRYLEALRTLAKAEKKDIARAEQEVGALQRQAAAAAAEHRDNEAAELSERGAAEAKLALNRLVDEVVEGYARLATEATNLGELKIAQTALDRAKEVRAMRRD